MAAAYGGNGSRRPPPDPEQIIADIFNRLRGALPGGLPGGLGAIALLVVLSLGWFATGIYQVNPSEVGIVLRFGEAVQTTTPGLHWHLPWPIERVLKPPVDSVDMAWFTASKGGMPASHSNTAQLSVRAP